MDNELPNFGDVTELIEEIHRLMLAKNDLDNTIKAMEVGITLAASTEPEHFQAGKPPSQEFIKNTFRYSGFNGELLDLRSRLGVVTADLEKAKSLLQLVYARIDVWRTLQANQRFL